MAFPLRGEVIERLKRELGYGEFAAERIADSIEKLHPSLHTVFLHWWHLGEMPTIELEIEGYSYQSLMTRRQMKPLGALLALSWLLREPDVAKQALAHGYDRAVTREP